MNYEREAEFLERLNEFRQSKPEESESPINYAAIIAALKEFPECIRYLHTRRSKGAIINIESEADVQDVIYLMLRPLVHDLVPENPTDKVAGRFSIGDFRSKGTKTIIEAKYIRNKDHGKGISEELFKDIESYRNDPHCDHIVFFIYDEELLIPDREGLKTHIEEERIYGGRHLHCHLIVMP